MSSAYRGTALVAVGFLAGAIAPSTAIGFYYRHASEVESRRWLFVAK
jgi:hypothetical protein